MKNAHTPKYRRAPRSDALTPQLVKGNGTDNEYYYVLVRVAEGICVSMPFDWSLILCRKLSLNKKSFHKLIQTTGREIIAAGGVVKGQFSSAIRAAINAQQTAQVAQ